MKKNFTANISGIIFNIDEDAFEKLNAYLDSIHRHFSGEDSKEEICNDIESRVAEMLQDRITETKKIITIEDVAEVIGVMGQPFEFNEDEPESKDEPRKPRGAKRLYRDTDDKVIGGVASGMAAYFNTDPIWFRLGFVVSFFFSGPLLYILFWLVIPAASSTAEKLEMRGEPVNVSTIEKSIREELNHLADKIKDLKNDGTAGFKKKVNEHRSGFEKLVDAFILLAHYFIKGFIMIMGIVLILISISLAIPFIASFFHPSGLMMSWGPHGAHWVSIPGVLDLLYTDSRDMLMAIAGISFFVGVPLIMLLYHGIKMLFGIKFHSRAIGGTAFGLWVIGIILSGVASFRLVQEFRADARVEEITELSAPVDNTYFISFTGWEEGDDCVFDDFKYDKDDPLGPFSRYPDFDIRRSKDSTARVITYKTARGSNQEEATVHAGNASYPLEITDSRISIPAYYHLSPDSKWRKQEVRLVVELPVGSRISASPEIDKLISHSDNWLHFPSDFGGKTWLMTRENGLVQGIE